MISHTINAVEPVAQLDIGIDMTRTALVGAPWFDRVNCAQGIKCLDGYQYEWNDKLGVWSREPLHNWASHGADAWRQFAQGYEAGGEADESIAAFKNRSRSWREPEP